MKKTIFSLLFIIVILNSLPAQEEGSQAGNITEYNWEVQILGGLEFGAGVFSQSFGISDGADTIALDSDNLYFALGLSFATRRFNIVESKHSTGFFFRSRALVVTGGSTTGTLTLNGFTEKINDKYSLDDDNIITFMDFNFGPSFRNILSERWQFYLEPGINFTIMEDEDLKTGDLLNYWGVGLYFGTAFQLNLSKNMFLEFGLNSIINIISSQEITLYDSGSKIKFEDAGRFDLTASAIYIQFGWRINRNFTIIQR